MTCKSSWNLLGEEELTVVVPAEIKKTSSWCTKLHSPDHMPSHKKKQN
jgi:hypothetical protein